MSDIKFGRPILSSLFKGALFLGRILNSLDKKGLSPTIFNNTPQSSTQSSHFQFFNKLVRIYRTNECVGMKNFMIYIAIDIPRLIFDYQNDSQCDNKACNEVGTPRRLILFLTKVARFCVRKYLVVTCAFWTYPHFTPTFK